jgi:hypothetical protein
LRFAEQQKRKIEKGVRNETEMKNKKKKIKNKK